MLTHQEILDKIVDHFYTQSKKSGSIDEQGIFECRYRAVDGSMCAVGALIKDEFYDVEIEGFPVRSRCHILYGQAEKWEILKKSLILSGVDAADAHTCEFLNRIQGIHDNMDETLIGDDFNNAITPYLYKIATLYRLNTSNLKPEA